MRYSQMTLQQRQQLLEDPQNYPLRVDFFGKTGLLSVEGVALLICHGVDFSLDDAQANGILLRETSMAAPTSISEEEPYHLAGMSILPPPSPRDVADLWTGVMMITAAIATAFYFLSRFICRFQPGAIRQYGDLAGAPPLERGAARKKKGESMVGRARRLLPELRFFLAILQEAGQQMREIERREAERKQHQSLIYRPPVR
ncbi:MAG: hypothetical protein M1531_05510 [Chloroflexi bacterium]|nr:hypothetical protein [Chloroflexota bacterium]